MRYRLQRHDGTDCSATMVPITVLRMVPIQRYRHFAESGYIAYPSEYTFVFIAEPFGITVLPAFQIISQRSREIMLSSQMESFRYHPIVRLKSIGSFIRYRVIGSQCYSRQKLSFFPHTHSRME